MLRKTTALGPLFAVALVGLALLSAASAGEEGDARLSGLEARVADGWVRVTFDLEGAFDDEVRERIASGLATSFTYELRLVRPRRLWFDKALGSSTVEVVARYNALTREYSVNTKRGGELVDSRVVGSAEELEAAATRLEDFPALELTGLRPGRPMVVRARAELGTRTILSLIPAIRTTDWAESSRFEIPAGG